MYLTHWNSCGLLNLTFLIFQELLDSSNEGPAYLYCLIIDMIKIQDSQGGRDSWNLCDDLQLETLFELWGLQTHSYRIVMLQSGESSFTNDLWLMETCLKNCSNQTDKLDIDPLRQEIWNEITIIKWQLTNLPHFKLKVHWSALAYSCY